jgi:hypothetical protein
MSRALLHVATDWPGHFPNVAATIAALVEAGADVNARFRGPHAETPLHWAASSNDVEALDALLDSGADIEAGGGVIGGGTPLADARAFLQWEAAYRLVERGAETTLSDAATLGLMDRLDENLDQEPSADEINAAFWGACHGGQQGAAEYLLDRGADINWIPYWEPLTPLDRAVIDLAPDLLGDRVGDRLGRLDLEVHHASSAVAPKPVAHVEVLLEVVKEREVEERPPVGGQLHARRQPALHDCKVAGGEMPVQLVHVGAHFEARRIAGAWPDRSAGRRRRPCAAREPSPSPSGMPRSRAAAGARRRPSRRR